MNRYLYLSLLVFAIFFVACKPSADCYIEEAVHCHLLLQVDSITVQGDTVRMNSLDSITVQGVGSDSILYDNTKAVASINLPLKKNSNTTQFELVIHNQTEKITINHQNDEHFISLACGCFVYHTIETASFEGSLIDSLTIVNAAIENAEQDNLKLYLMLK